MNQYLLNTTNEKVKTWINNNLKKYLDTNPENEQEIFHIVDYLNQYEDTNDKMNCFSYEKVKKSAKKWTDLLIQQGKKAVETEESVETIIKFDKDEKTGEEMKLVKLVDKSSFEREGALMSHCVSSYHGKSDVKVYSLRDRFNKPHCTIEVYGDKSINQIKGKGNGKIHPKYINYIIRILEHFEYEISTNDMTNLGYIEINNDELKFLNDEFGKFSLLSILTKNYIYSGDKIWTVC